MANEITGCTPDFIVDNSKLDGEEEEVEQFVNDNGFVDLEDSEVGNSVAGESPNEYNFLQGVANSFSKKSNQ